jgi:hypothetical protein
MVTKSNSPGTGGRHNTGHRGRQEFCSETGFEALISVNSQKFVRKVQSLRRAVPCAFAPRFGAWYCFRRRLRPGEG